jgi:Holliday junction resolvasome RuvABC ATP-dependent DNA helicase subunit
MNRTSNYNIFRDLLDKDKVSLKQQLFLEKYVEKYYKIDNIIDRLLIYHGIGTGKTRTSIIIAERLVASGVVILSAEMLSKIIKKIITKIK